MASQDDLALLKQMYERGEISDEQYDTLRRHVLWGTPLPELIDEADPYADAGPTTQAWTPPHRPGVVDPRPTPASHQDLPPDPRRPPAGDPRLGRPPAGPADRGPTGWQREDDPRGWGREPRERSEWERGGGRDLRERSEWQPGDGPGLGGPAWAGASAPARWDGPVGARDEPDEDDWAQPARKGGRRRRAPKVAALVTSMLLALALVAAGVWWFAFRETGVPAADYARTVCTSVRDWQQQVDGRSTALVTSIAQQQANREGVRSTVQGYYADLATRTDGLRTAITGAGVVDVDGGEEYAESFAGVVGDQATALRDLAGRAERLDTGSAAVFQIQLQSLLTGAQTAVGRVTAALARPPAGTPTPLRTALSAEPACAPYVG